MLMFNGIGANMELAGLLMSELDAVETVIFDVPGAGKSPAPRFPYRMFTMARLARNLLDELGYGTVDVMGVSWGGGLAQQFAIQYPKRVRRLVLAATAMGALTMLPGHPRVLLKMINPRRYADKGYMKRVAPDLYGGDLRARSRGHQALHRPCRGGDRRGYKYQMLAMLGWTSLPFLWRIRHPDAGIGGQRRPAGAAHQCPPARLAAARCALACASGWPSVPADPGAGDCTDHREVSGRADNASSATASTADCLSRLARPNTSVAR